MAANLISKGADPWRCRCAAIEKNSKQHKNKAHHVDFTAHPNDSNTRLQFSELAKQPKPIAKEAKPCGPQIWRRLQLAHPTCACQFSNFFFSSLEKLRRGPCQATPHPCQALRHPLHSNSMPLPRNLTLLQSNSKVLKNAHV